MKSPLGGSQVGVAAPCRIGACEGIVLIRHGETEWSVTGQHTGCTDLTLTQSGERGAAGLRCRLRSIRFSRVFTSPLARAQRTCVLAGLGTEMRTNADLREWDYGDYEGLTSEEIYLQKPHWNVFMDGCPSGESVRQIATRADRLLAQLRSIPGTVALFSHGHFLRSLAMRWIGLPVGEGRHFALDASSLSILGYEHPSSAIPVISTWNNVGSEPVPR